MLDEALTPLAAAGDPVFAEDLVARLGLRQRGLRRPHLVAAMIASADGHATVGRALDRSRPPGRPRAAAGAARRRRRGARRAWHDPRRALREPARCGRAGCPRGCRPAVAADDRDDLARGDVPWDVGLFDERDAHVVVYTSTELEPPATAARVSVVALTELADVLAHLHAEDGARAILCEGGPTLLRALAAAELLDGLFLTVAPLLVAGGGPSPLSGEAIDPAARLVLVDVHGAGDHVFLHYQRP